MKTISLLLSLLFLTACSSEKDIEFTLPKEDLTLTITDKGITVTSCNITLNSSQYNVLLEYFSSNNSWQVSPASYIPGKLVTGKGFKANFLNDFVIIDDTYKNKVNSNIYKGLVCK